MTGRLRLDQLLVERGLARSRSQAGDMIRRGAVRVDDAVATRPGARLAGDADIAVDDPAGGYVSRAALKLIAGLDGFGFDPAGRVALDLGASTGGFTQVLLDRGAERVHAVDVGHGQLADMLAADARVTAHEGLNARHLTPDHLGERVGAIVADLSFISLTLVLPAALPLAAPGAWLMVLVKPQFELDPDRIGKGGIVTDEGDRQAAVRRVADCVTGLGWQVLDPLPSPVAGRHGNLEWLLGARAPA